MAMYDKIYRPYVSVFSFMIWDRMIYKPGQ